MIFELTAIYALWKREIIRYFRAPSRIASTLATPLFFLLIVGGGLSASISMPEGFQNTNYLQFLAPGIIGMTVLFASAFGGVSVIIDKQFGFLKEILVAPIRRTTIVIGKALGTATTATFQGLLLLAAVSLLGVNLNLSLESILLAALVMALLSITFLCAGLIIATRMDDVNGFQLAMNFFIMPAFLLSGALFPITNLPAWLQPFTFADPMTYAVDAMRAGFLGQSAFPLTTDLTVLGAFTLALILLASKAFEKMR